MKQIAPLVLWMVGLLGCAPRLESPPGDSPKAGNINISVDESFRPVIDEEIQMYEASYPDAKIVPHYKPEADCIKDFLHDTATRLVIVTRPLNENEEKFMIDSLGYIPPKEIIAFDAVVLLLNRANPDSLFTMQRLRDQMLGKTARDQEVVFDGKNATGAVRFIRDSILHGQMFDSSIVRGAANSDEVIDYVTAHPNAIGLVGINRIGNPEDSAQAKRLARLRFGYVQCGLCENKPFVSPMQESINSRRYPLVRPLYYLLKENYMGLGTGFTSFLKYERGQLIFRRAYLGTIMDFDVRNIKYNEKLPGD